jgi:hypothetical protein
VSPATVHRPGLDRQAIHLQLHLEPLTPWLAAGLLFDGTYEERVRRAGEALLELTRQGHARRVLRKGETFMSSMFEAVR